MTDYRLIISLCEKYKFLLSEYGEQDSPMAIIVKAREVKQYQKLREPFGSLVGEQYQTLTHDLPHKGDKAL